MRQEISRRAIEESFNTFKGARGNEESDKDRNKPDQ